MKTSKVSEVIEICRSKEKNNLESQLAAMASDREIQKELHKIDEKFSVAESDGLENLCDPERCSALLSRSCRRCFRPGNYANTE